LASWPNAFSPIDLIPDFIPVLGYVDDLLLLPIGVLIMLRMTPDHIVIECRERACAHLQANAGKPRSRWGAVLALGGWLIVVMFIGSLRNPRVVIHNYIDPTTSVPQVS